MGHKGGHCEVELGSMVFSSRYSVLRKYLGIQYFTVFWQSTNSSLLIDFVTHFNCDGLDVTARLTVDCEFQVVFL